MPRHSPLYVRLSSLATLFMLVSCNSPKKEISALCNGCPQTAIDPFGDFHPEHCTFPDLKTEEGVLELNLIVRSHVPVTLKGRGLHALARRLGITECPLATALVKAGARKGNQQLAREAAKPDSTPAGPDRNCEASVVASVLYQGSLTAPTPPEGERVTLQNVKIVNPATCRGTLQPPQLKNGVVLAVAPEMIQLFEYTGALKTDAHVQMTLAFDAAEGKEPVLTNAVIKSIKQQGNR